MKKIMQPCGLHCIKMQDIGVTIGEQNILQHVNLHIHCGTLAAVIGKNGAGKSTLIRAILGDIPHTGTIEFKNRENGHMQKMRIGYVPQSLNMAQYADQVILIDGTVKKQGTVRQVYESEEFQEVFGKFDLENYKPSRQVKEQKEKEIAMPKHNHSLWKEDV